MFPENDTPQKNDDFVRHCLHILWKMWDNLSAWENLLTEAVFINLFA